MSDENFDQSLPLPPLTLTYIWWPALLTAAAPICRINYSPTLDARPFLRSLFSFFDGQCRFGNLAIQPLWRLCLFCQAPLFFRFWRAVPIWEAVKGDFEGGNWPPGTDGLWQAVEQRKASSLFVLSQYWVLSLLFKKTQKQLRVRESSRWRNSCSYVRVDLIVSFFFVSSSLWWQYLNPI